MKAQPKPSRPSTRPAGDKCAAVVPRPAPRKIKREPLKRARPGRDTAIVKVES